MAGVPVQFGLYGVPLALLAYVAIAFAVHLDWREVARATLAPKLTLDHQTLLTIVALVSFDGVGKAVSVAHYDLDVPVARWEGPPREGPLFAGVPWPSLGAAHLAHLAISAALHAREITGRGQRVDTSLLNGA